MHLAVPCRRAVQAIRAAGLRTALLSNSWGMADYPRHLFPGMFDVVVISGEVGMRKRRSGSSGTRQDLLGLDPAKCVFIDDIEVNVTARRGDRNDRDPAPRSAGDARPPRRASRPSLTG